MGREQLCNGDRMPELTRPDGGKHRAPACGSRLAHDGSREGVGDSRIRSVAVLIAVPTSGLGCSGSGRRRPTATLWTAVRARSARAVACRSVVRLRSRAARLFCRL